jgi:hypothetical protein
LKANQKKPLGGCKITPKTLGIDEKEVLNLLNSSMRLSLISRGGMMPILVEITYEDGTLKTSSIQLKSGEKNNDC